MSRTHADPGRAATAAPQPSPWVFNIGLLVFVALFVASSASFLRFQSIWVDETTQLSGMALGFERLFPWLLGQGPDLGVPPDRMPPLSYLLGMLWGGLGSPSETSMRWFGLICAVIGLLATVFAARRVNGPLGALIAAAFLAASPTLLVYAPEIRAYPVFFMFSALATYAFVGSLQAELGSRVRWMGWLTVALVLATYTHYFGIILAAAVIGALLVDALRFDKPIGPVIVCGAASAVLAAGIVPFVLAAVKISGGPVQPILVSDVMVRASKLVYRLYGHPALANSTVMTIVASAGFGVLLLGSMLAARRSHRVQAGLITVALVGVAMVLGAAFLTRGFDTLAPHYNFWLVPIVTLLLASGAVWLIRWRLPVGVAAVVMLLIGCGYSTALIQARPGVYAHGPQRQIIALIDALGPAKVDVVYDATGGGSPGHVFFPLRYRYGPSLPQYKVETAAEPAARFDPNDPVQTAPSRKIVIVIAARDVQAVDLARMFRTANAAPALLPVAEALRQRGWQSLSLHKYVGLLTADVEVLAQP